MTPSPSVGSAVNSDTMQCRICHTRPARPDGAVCWVCLGSEADDPAPAAVTMIRVKPEAGRFICPICDKIHDGFMLGRALVDSCRDCVVAKRKETWSKNRHNHKRHYAADAVESTKLPAKPKPVIPAPEPTIICEPPANILLLDFSRHPELLEKIRQISVAHFRTPEAQILWLISTMEWKPISSP